MLDIDGRDAWLHMNALRKYETSFDENHDITTDGETDEPHIVSISVVITDDDGVDTRQATVGLSHPTTDDRIDGERFMIGEQLDVNQRRAIKGLLTTYSDLFADEPGCMHLMQHSIKVTDTRPCFQPSCRIPEALWGDVECELRDMEAQGIIEYDPHAIHNSPLVIVRKNNGKLRLCNNFIQLNKRTVSEPYLMTNTTELLNRVAGAKYISKVDMTKAYYQIEMQPSSRQYTSFQTPFGV